MNLLKRVSFCAALVSVAPALCHAYFSQDNSGEEAFSFVSTFDSPRNAALERSAGAMPSTDPTVSQMNLAALRVQEGKKHVVEAHWQTGDFAENQGSLFYTTKYKDYAIQISYNWYDVGEIQGVDEMGEYTNQKYNPFGHLFTAGLAFPMKHIQFGAGLKVVAEKLAEERNTDRTAIGAAFDWGIAWQNNSNSVGLSLAGKDFGAMLRDYSDDGEEDYYAMSQAFTASAFFKPKSIRRLTMYTATEFPRFTPPILDIGAEYALGKSFTIRGGWTRSWLDLVRDIKELAASNSRPDEANTARLFSLGLGYSSSLFALDYAFSYLAQGLGMEHRIGLRLGF